MDLTADAFCSANNRDNQPCRRRPSRDKARCHYHGGAPGSGGQPRNANALKHGFYSSRLREMASDILEATDQPLQLLEEIALLRAVLVRAAPIAPPQALAVITGTLARLIMAQYKLSVQVPELFPNTFYEDLADELAQVASPNHEE